MSLAKNRRVIKMMNKEASDFFSALQKHIKKLRSFPWRKTCDPYEIIVSEIMLQQTQTHRVMPKYQNFLKKFPTLKSLARAQRVSVLKTWSGLGYYQRSSRLHDASKILLKDFNGVIPSNEENLSQLPGFGTYTTRAVLVFAFNQNLPLIETNTRTAIIYHFFRRKKLVKDSEIESMLVELTKNIKNPRTFYYALMDYGAHLKSTKKNFNTYSSTYKKQSPFHGSTRQARGKALSLLLENKHLSDSEISRRIKSPKKTVQKLRKELKIS